jgi:hypothetical protein
LHRERCNAEAQQAEGDLPLLRLSAARLTRQELEAFDQHVEQQVLSKADMQKSQQEVEKPVATLASHEADTLSSMRTWPRRSRTTAPTWEGAVATHRDFFKNAVFRFQDQDGGVVHLLFLFARQAGPQMVGFVAVSPVAVSLPRGDLDFWRWDAESWEHIFETDGLNFVYTDRNSFAEAWQLTVLLGVCQLADGMLGADGPFRPWGEITRLLPQDLQSGPREPDDAEAETDRPYQADTWAAAYFLTNRGARGEAGSKAQPEECAVDRPEEAAEPGQVQLEEALFEEAMRDLEQARATAADEASARPAHFGWHLRGGRWTKEHTGKSFDSWRGTALGSRAASWCKENGLQTTATFSTGKFGMQGSMRLATCWAYHMQALYNAGGAQVLEASGDVSSGAAPPPASLPPEATAWEAEGDSAFAARLAEIRALRTRHRPASAGSAA